MKVDRTLVASITLHVLVLGWGLISFSARSVESVQDSLPVDIITDAQFAKMTQGLKTGDKNQTKPLAEKIGDVKPVEDNVGKITEKQIDTSVAPEQQPKPVDKPADKPVEKKPDPPKPVAETKPTPDEKKPDPAKVDPIAEALKSEEAKKPKPKPVQQAKAAPQQPPKPKPDRVFDQSKIAALLDKRDPTRQSITGAVLNSNAALGTHTGNSDAIIATWKGAFVAAVKRCFNFPYNGTDYDQFAVDIDVNMRPDGTVDGQPVIVAVRGPSRSVADAIGQSASRAILQCQAYAFLPKDHYDTWKYIPLTFNLNDLL